MNTQFRQTLAERILTVICWLVEQWFGDEAVEDVSTLAITEVHFPNERIIIKGDFNYMELKEGQYTVVTATPQTRAGNRAKIEPNSVRVEFTDEDIVSFEHPFEDDELKVKITGTDGSANGSTLLTLRADGIAGEGEREIVGTLNLVVTQGDAFVFDLQGSAPADVTVEGDPEGTGSTPPPS